MPTANIICIASGTLRPGVHVLGDIVDVRDGGVALGRAYDTFDIIPVEVKARLY